MAYLTQRPPAVFSASSSVSGKRRVPDNDDGLYREAVDFTDVEQLLIADAKRTGFKLILEDATCGISLYSRPVEDCPMHLMRAEGALPCTPAELLKYLDVPVRQQWDNYIAELRCVRVLRRPRGMTNISDITDVERDTGSQLQPGQRRVSLQYMAIHTPIPLVQDRDFEMVVAEEVRCDGTAWVKAFSTPLGYIEPLDPHQSKYVRALMLFSGVMARPLVSSKGRLECHVSYVALVHPMGLIPSVIVNLVLGAQLKALRKLKYFILQHPPNTLNRPTIDNNKNINNDSGSGDNSFSSYDKTNIVKKIVWKKDSVEQSVNGSTSSGGVRQGRSRNIDRDTNKMGVTKNQKAVSLRGRLASLKEDLVDKLWAKL